MKNENKKRLLTVARKPGTRKDAFINVGGKWVENAGFKIGDIVELEVSEELIVIRRTNNKWAEIQEVHRERFMVNEQGGRLK